MTLSRKTFLRGGAAAVAALALAPSAIFAQERKKFVFATEGAFPPFNLTRPNGDLDGFEVELLAELAKRGNFDYELIAQGWDGMIQGVIDGKYDGVFDSVSITAKRLEVVDFALPYTTGGSTFVVMNDSGITLPLGGTQVDLDDTEATAAAVEKIAEVLAGKTVGVHMATIQSDFIEQYLVPKGVEIRTYPTGPEVYQDLKNGRIDAGIAAITNVAAFLEKNADVASSNGPTWIGGVFGRGAATVVKKGNTELTDLLNGGLKSMSDDGSLAALSQKWFGMNITPAL